MFEKVVLATDLSPAWDEIVACTGEFMALGAREVILTHVITVKFLGGLEATLKAEAEPRLEAEKQLLLDQGLKVQVEMPSGLPAYSLNDVARRHGTLGPQKKGFIQEFFLGSVAHNLSCLDPCPVLLIPPAAR